MKKALDSLYISYYKDEITLLEQNYSNCKTELIIPDGNVFEITALLLSPQPASFPISKTKEYHLHGDKMVILIEKCVVVIRFVAEVKFKSVKYTRYFKL